MKAFFLDAEPLMRKGESGVRLFLKTPQGKSMSAFAPFEPYFYLLLSSKDLLAVAEKLREVKAISRNKEARVKRVEQVEKTVLGKKTQLLKVICFNPSHVPKLREECKAFGQVYEHAIPFARRFVIDSGLVPESLIEWSLRERIVRHYNQLAPEEAFAKMPPMRAIAFDIETHSPAGLPNPVRDACIMISYALGDGEEKGVITYAKDDGGKKFVHEVRDEKQMLEAFAELVREKKIDLLCGYNSDEFDLPYLLERAKQTKADFNLSRSKKAKIVLKKLGLRRRARISGRIHFDAFNAAALLDYIGAFKFPRLTLGVVYNTLTGEQKLDTKKLDIWRAWDAGGKELEHLLEYSLGDALACKKIMDFVLPIEIALSRVMRMTLFDVSRATPAQMVESLLMRRAFERNEIVPNKPDYATVQARSDDAIKGAYVKMPSPGLYENIAVFDFRSLYPSIIVSYNIDPFTLNCPCCHPDDSFIAPTGARFCKQRTGLVPETLDRVLDERSALKEKMKKVKKAGEEYKQMDARQFALKILANSVYGYLVYSRSRYYSRECGEAITAFARHYIQDTINKAGENGFKVLYADTDSCFLLLGDKSREDALKFRDDVNSALPGRMELELEDFYPRGIFVSKKHEKEEKGAKKKYALVNDAGAIKIRGFELVRRDWSSIARNTQRKVLEILLKEGDVKKAIDFVREIIAELREEKVPISECAIRTQLRKTAGSYEVTSPELSAVRKALAQGVRVEEHALVEYVITKQGKSISEKAQLAELAKDYDAEYYVNNQVLPAVLKILGALGVREEDIKTKGAQKSLLEEW